MKLVTQTPLEHVNGSDRLHLAAEHFTPTDRERRTHNKHVLVSIALTLGGLCVGFLGGIVATVGFLLLLGS